MNAVNINHRNNESLILGEMFSKIENLKETDAQYYAYFEDADPDTASREELLDLIVNAPNDSVKYFLFGKFTMRLMISTITGREFK